MKSLLLSAALAALALEALPAAAGVSAAGTHISGPQALGLPGDDAFDRRGRGRGRGHDDARGTQSGDDRNGGHGGRPRVPGGSGCDDPQDLIEHPECRG